MLNKKINVNLFIIAQCIIMFNFYLCTLRIYAEKLVIYSYFLIGVAVVLFLLSGIYKKFKLSFMPTAFIVLFGYMLLTDVINANFSSFDCYMAIACFLLCYFFSFFLNDKEDNIKSLTYNFYVCLACSTLLSIFSLIVIFKNNDLGGIAVERNALASCACISIIGSYWLFNKKNILSLKNVIILFCDLINIFTLIKTESRTPLTLLATFIIVMLAYYAFFVFGKKFNKVFILVLFILISLLIIGIVLSFIIKRNAVDSSAGSIRNIIDRISSSRLSIWEACFDLIAESPITGVNNDTFHQKTTGPLGFYVYHQHNVYIGLMTIHGIPSFLIYLAIIIFTIFNSLKLIFTSKDKEVIKRVSFFFAFLLGILVSDLFECFTFYSFIPYAFIVFLVYNSIEIERLSMEKDLIKG